MAARSVRYVTKTQGAPPLPPRVVTTIRATTQSVIASCRRVSIPRRLNMVETLAPELPKCRLRSNCGSMTSGLPDFVSSAVSANTEVTDFTATGGWLRTCTSSGTIGLNVMDSENPDRYEWGSARNENDPESLSGGYE